MVVAVVDVVVSGRLLRAAIWRFFVFLFLRDGVLY